MRTHLRLALFCSLLFGLSSSAWAYYDCGWYGPNFEWECIWYPDPPVLNGDEAQVQQERYYLRSGDLNLDGKTDFLVTGAYALRRVQDFVVLSSGAGYQTVLYANLGAYQQGVVSGWPIDNAPVTRTDINLDGYFDFVLSEVVNGDSMAVLTNGSDGRTPASAVVVDAQVRRAAAEIQQAVLHPSETLASYDYTYSYTTWVEGWYDCSYWYYDSYYPGWCYFAYPITVTYHGRDTFHPITQSFIDGNRTALTNGTLGSAFTSANWLPGYGAAAVTGLGAAVLDSPIAMRVGWFALRVAIVGVTGVSAPAIITGIVVTAAVYGIWHVVNEVYSDPAPSDVGPVPTTTPANPDPFEPCQRNTNVYQELPDDRTPAKGGATSIGALRAASKRNLERTGCVRPADANAHHGIPLREGEGGAGDTLREWARVRGINITEEANQIYLPKNSNAATKAALHNADLHSEQAMQEFYNRLVVREAQGLSPRDALRSVNNDIATGNFKW